jgi:hypothetical protein
MPRSLCFGLLIITIRLKTEYRFLMVIMFFVMKEVIPPLTKVVFFLRFVVPQFQDPALGFRGIWGKMKQFFL